MLRGSPIVSVPVLTSGVMERGSKVDVLVDRALYKSLDWKTRLKETSESRGLDSTRIASETDPSDLAEGLYIKIEKGERVVGRCKFVRSSFLTAVIDSETHWLNRPIVPNCLRDDVDLFGNYQ